MKPNRLNINNKGCQMDIRTNQCRLVGMPFSGLRTAFLWVLLVFFPAAQVYADGNVQLLMVDAGSQRTVMLDKAAQRIAVGSGDIAQIKLLSKKELLLQGVK